MWQLAGKDRLALIVVCLALLCSPLRAGAETSESPMRIVASVVGPRNVTYLPMDMIPILGADKAEGVQLVLRYADGGGVALKELANRNSDFAVTGLPAQMYQRASGGKIITIAAVNDLPLFVFLVRQELKGEVRRPADLKGRVIGVATSSITAKTTAQQLADLYLREDGVQEGEARFIPTGQDWEVRLEMLRNGRVDAMMVEEPFATRLLEEGVAFELANTAQPNEVLKIPGSGFLFAVLATRPDVIKNNDVMVQRMIKMLRRSLAWLASHGPEEVVEKLAIQDPVEKRLLLAVLQRYPRLYSKDGAFSTQQLQETEVFFQASNEGLASSSSLRLETMLNDQWVGRRE